MPSRCASILLSILIIEFGTLLLRTRGTTQTTKNGRRRSGGRGGGVGGVGEGGAGGRREKKWVVCALDFTSDFAGGNSIGITTGRQLTCVLTNVCMYTDVTEKRSRSIQVIDKHCHAPLARTNTIAERTTGPPAVIPAT